MCIRDSPLPDYKQFISDKFPNWHLTDLEETEFEEVEFECQFAIIPIRLTKENGEPFDFSYALSRGFQKFNYFNFKSEDRFDADIECDRGFSF